MSDDESEYFENILPIQKCKFVSAVNEIVSIHQECNTENAISLNRKMQNMLRELQQVVMEMITKCRDKYEQNEQILSNSLSKINLSTKNDIKYFSTYTICGIPFFKNLQNSYAPPNADYLYRKNVQNELFPVDIFMKKNMIWTLKDKINVIKGVKSQAARYIKDRTKKCALETKYITRHIRNQAHKNNDQVSLSLLVDLLKQTDENFKINWYLLFSDELENRHSESSCEAMWNLYLHPELSRLKWSKQETEKLNKIMLKNNFSNWSIISKEMGNRSEYQCYIHYITFISENVRFRKDKWTKKDDKLLIDAVEKSRMGNVIRWNIVQQYFPDRNKRQLNTRYIYSLDPKIKRGFFTQEEDCNIMAAVERYGVNFSNMPISLFPGRNIVQVRNRYHNTLKFINKHKTWTVEDDKKLLDFVEKNGTTEWIKIAKEFGYRNRTSCRQRYITIMKILKKNPNLSIEKLPRKNKPLKSNVTLMNWKDKISEISQNIENNEDNSNFTEHKKSEKSNKRKKEVQTYVPTSKTVENLKKNNQTECKGSINSCGKKSLNLKNKPKNIKSPENVPKKKELKKRAPVRKSKSICHQKEVESEKFDSLQMKKSKNQKTKNIKINCIEHNVDKTNEILLNNANSINKKDFSEKKTRDITTKKRKRDELKTS